MADEKIKNKNRLVDSNGIRLAPTPIRNSDYHVLPSVRQEFVLEPSLQIDEPRDEISHEVSTTNDFQPKVKDKNKKWKRQKRGKNIVFGAIMIVFTVIVVLPYILAAIGQEVSLPIKYVPTELNAIGNVIDAFKVSAENGWASGAVKEIWLDAVPSLVLCFGLLFLVFNAIKSLCALLGAVRPVKYIANAIVYLVCVLTVLVIYLMGVNLFSVAQIDFMDDFLRAYSTSELFALVVLAIANVIVSMICTLINKDKLGYIG
ncbi:MAG: hypothetical protein II867_00870 [Clostridia bacterium]|nr:hypothetical protein [Clostridia bacterium]